MKLTKNTTLFLLLTWVVVNTLLSIIGIVTMQENLLLQFICAILGTPAGLLLILEYSK